MPKNLNPVGQQFGRLTVLRFARQDSRKKNCLYLCKCTCGNETEVRTDALPKTKSCGCLLKESSWNIRHGMTKTPEYRVYSSAKSRCTNPKIPKWRLYGGRGIEFRFKSFEEFLIAVGLRPSDEYSIDRFPNKDSHYESGNVRWATISEQNSNRRTYHRRRKIV